MKDNRGLRRDESVEMEKGRGREKGEGRGGEEEGEIMYSVVHKFSHTQRHTH